MNSDNERKAELDAFRRDLERRIVAGEYRPECEPSHWWELWARIERDVLKDDD